MRKNAKQPLTSYAGLMLPQQAMDDSGFMDQADARLPATASNHCYPPSELLSMTVLLHLVGGETLADIRKFQRDGLFHEQVVPTDRCLADWMARFGTSEGMDALRELQRIRLCGLCLSGSVDAGSGLGHRGIVAGCSNRKWEPNCRRA